MIALEAWDTHLHEGDDDNWFDVCMKGNGHCEEGEEYHAITDRSRETMEPSFNNSAQSIIISFVDGAVISGFNPYYLLCIFLAIVWLCSGGSAQCPGAAN